LRYPLIQRYGGTFVSIGRCTFQRISGLTSGDWSHVAFVLDFGQADMVYLVDSKFTSIGVYLSSAVLLGSQESVCTYVYARWLTFERIASGGAPLAVRSYQAEFEDISFADLTLGTNANQQSAGGYML
jgi:hypothetical protein